MGLNNDGIRAGEQASSSSSGAPDGSCETGTETVEALTVEPVNGQGEKLTNEAEKLTGEADDAEAAIRLIQAAIQAHETRSEALGAFTTDPSEGGPAGAPGFGGNSLRSKIHIARPWQKKRPSLAPSLTLNAESSEEEVLVTSSSSAVKRQASATVGAASACRSVQSVFRSHEVRKSALERLEADRDLFTSGKVSAMMAKFNERRNRRQLQGGSDGVTDDDDDVVVE